ncbi:hypothetical protein SAMN05421837_103823 [Amycolatopsis pretoriensis]|uniref:Bacterial HORMA domain-containing protein n=1 Tax=Amycolatopsis pretoriensis TaxID=218821 RepID=A0A1H5QMW9_9PSEU|nr:hypothetical protein [Amycolatopsis pretoriensis]SEF27416.1 hypothetical protein SAMN05421837_103823 [Amycolatopsis pretoriensis]
MTTSYTRSEAGTYSLASAKYVASKIATDLRQVQRYYGRPSDSAITDYALEAALLSHGGYVDKVIYGFQRDGDWILTLEYTAANGTLIADDRAGGIYRHADTDGAVFTSFLHYSLKWSFLPSTDRDEFTELLPFSRTDAPAPGYTGGYHTFDRTYSSSGTGFTRSTYRPR